MIRTTASFVATALVFAGLDFVWLSTAQTSVYRPTLDPVLSTQVNLPAAVAFYLVYLTGVFVLVVAPAARARSVLQAATRGAATGALAYATYDLTNQATLKVWATSITLADIGWGTFLTGVACTVGAWVWLRLARSRG